MAYYLWQIAYTTESWAAQLKNPKDRTALVRPVAEKLGGKLIDAWFAFGEYDVVVILEMPDNVTAAAMVLAATTAGHIKASKTTPLIPIADGLEAMKKAATVTYPVPGR
jgi:uncharacterized protein with GYD domain